MRLRLNLSLRRALMSAMFVASTLMTTTSWGGVAIADYDLQYYLDFARNKGMFAAGATDIGVYFKDGTSVSNPVIPLMPNLDSYAQRGQIIMNSLSPLGGANLVAPQFVSSANHCYENDVYFLSENSNTSVCYTSTGFAGQTNGDWSMQRLNKIVTEVAYTPMADASFIASLSKNEWIYRLGNGGAFNTEGNSLYLNGNTLGGIVNVDSVTNLGGGNYQLIATMRAQDGADIRPPLEIGVTQGDSGSPMFAWDEENQRFLYIGFLSAGAPIAGYGNYLVMKSNPAKSQEFIDSYSINVSDFAGKDTIQWGGQDTATGQGTLSQGDVAYTYTGAGTGNTVYDHLGINFSTADTENTQNIELQGSVNMGAGALTFENGSWSLSEADSSNTFNSAGFVVNKGAELTLELTATSAEEWRKVGEGIMTIAGSGNNEAVLRVGGGTTVYNVATDENGNITGCTLGNAGETRLNRTDGYAASSVRLEGGVAILVLMADGQFKTNTTAGDTFTFGNAGGLLNLNGHDLTWGVINQDGSGTGARIGNFTPQGEETPGTATFTYTGSGKFQGCFMDEGAEGAKLAVVYNNATEGASWVLTGNHTNVGGFTVEAGTMVLEGSNTPHVLNSDKGDWTYATLEGSDVTVKDGATFQLSHHALMTGNVVVEDGGAFVLNQTANEAFESINGSLRLDMASLESTSFRGNVTLAGNATMTANINSPVATTMKGSIIGSGSAGTQFTKSGNGVFVVDGQMLVARGEVMGGGLVVTDSTNFAASSSSAEWTIGEAGFLAVEGMDNAEALDYVSTSSSGVLALTSNQESALAGLSSHDNLYIGAYGDTPIEYGNANETLSANSDGKWLLGGGGGTLNVNFLLTGGNDLIIGNEYSNGTVHLTNTANNFTGDIYIKGTGNMLTYEDGALGEARVNLSYGNSLSLHNEEGLSILKDGAKGVLALTQSMDLDLTGKTLAIGANGDVTFSNSLKVDDTYRFGGMGNLTIDTELDGTKTMAIDGQGTTGSSVTFARENAFSGSILAGGGLELAEPNSAGNIAIHVTDAMALADTESLTLQKGATLYTDGQDITVGNLNVESGAYVINNGTTSSTLTLDVSAETSTSIVNGAINDASNSATMHLVKTGSGTLTLGNNNSWSGGLTIKEGTVNVGAYTNSSSVPIGLGATNMPIVVEENGVLNLTFSHRSSGDIDQVALPQYVSGNGTVRISSGGAMMFSDKDANFSGTVEVVGNTRLYIGRDFVKSIAPVDTFSNQGVFDDATVSVADGSQVRITNMFRYGLVNGAAATTSADFIIAGDGFAGTDNGTYGAGSVLKVGAQLNSGALSVDLGSVITGNVSLADDATISSWSNIASTPTTWNGYVYGTSSYGLIDKLGGTIRGQILGEGKTLTLGGNEGLTFSADSANTYGDLVISNGNGNNSDKFALRLNNGEARSQTSTALGLGTVTLNDGLILRLAGTGVADNTSVVYTYENAMNVGTASTLQSYNVTNRLTGAVVMTGNSLNLSTANGGVLELAGGIQGNGTLNVTAGSKVILGALTGGDALARANAAQFSGSVITGAGVDFTLASPAVLDGGTTFTGTDSLTLRLNGTEDFTLGGIALTDSDTSDALGSALTLHFDFTDVPDATDADTWSTLNVANGISADSTIIALDLNLFNDIKSGDYTLISSTDTDTSYTLADSQNGRFSLSTENGALVLTVGADNRLYWSDDSATQVWNAEDMNWYQESSLATDKMVSFSTDANVIFDGSGVGSGNSIDAPEMVTLGSDVAVSTMIAKDAVHYAIALDSHTLSGDSMVIGDGVDLSLSDGSISFANGVQVDNASLALSGVTLNSALHIADGGTASITSSTLNADITTAGSGSLSLDAAVLGNNTISFENGSALTSSEATLSGELSWQKDVDVINVASLSLTAGALSSNAALEVEKLAIGSGLTVTLNGAASSSIQQITGGGKLVMQSSGSLQLGSANVQTLKLLAGETQVTDAVSVSEHLSIGKATLNIEDGGVVEVSHFTAGNEANGNSSVVNINGGTLSITGTTAGDTNGSSFLLAHWKNLTSELNLNSGTIEAGNTTMHMGWDSGGTFKAMGGTANLGGVLFSSQRNNSADTFILGSATEGSATLKIGAFGITGTTSNDKFQLGEGTIAASADFAISGAATAQLVGSVSGTKFDTNGHNITINSAISGNGILNKLGEGTLTLAGNGENYTGSIFVQGGKLALGHSASVGSLSGLSIAGAATLDLSGISLDSFTGLALADGATATIESGAHFVLHADTVANTVYTLFDLGENATLSGWDASTLSADNFSVGAVCLADMGRVSLSLDSYAGTFSYYQDIYDLVWNGGESGTWNRDEVNTTWVRTIAGEQLGNNIAFANYDNVSFNSAATVTLGEDLTASSVTIAKADDSADDFTVTLNESQGSLTATSILVDKGATLAFATEKAGYTAGNISGTGTVELDLTNSWNNKVLLGSSFAGETYVTSGYFNLTGAQVGDTLRLADGVNANASGGAATVSANVILEGTSIIHANTGCPITYNGTVTGDNGVFESNGSTRHIFNAEVDLAGFNTAHASNTNTFNAKTTLDSASLTQATVNFNAETAIGTATLSGSTVTFAANGSVGINTANISAGTVKFNGETTLTTANFNGGTTTFSGATELTTANFNAGTVNFATDSLTIGAFNRGAGDINFKLASGADSTTYNVGSISGKNAGIITIDQGVVLNASSISTTNENVSRKLIVNGELNIAQNLNYSGYYSSGETFSGDGVINVEGNAYVRMYDGAAKFDVNQFNVGGDFILDVFAWGGRNFDILDGTVSVTGKVDNTRGGGGTGSDYAYLNIAGGSLVMKGGAVMSTGQLNINSGSLVQAGGVSSISNTVNMTGGELSVTGGSMNISSTTVTGTGGSISVSGGELVLGANAATALLGGANAVSVSGGVLDLSAMPSGEDSTNAIVLADAAVVTLGEGTLRASDSISISGSNGVSLVGTDGGTTFDTNTHDITMNAELTGSGKLVKNGEGNLILTAQNTYTGDTSINAGSVQMQGSGQIGAGDVRISAGANLTAATAATGGISSEIWARINSVSNTAVAMISGASVTQTEKSLRIASRTAGKQGILDNSLVQIAADANLILDGMMVSDTSRIFGSSVTYDARSISQTSQLTLTESTIVLGSGNNSSILGTDTVSALSLQAVGYSGEILSLTESSVMTITSDALSNLTLTGGSSFTVDFSNLLNPSELGGVDFVLLSFNDVSFTEDFWNNADTSITGLEGLENLDVYFSLTSPNDGMYFDVRSIPEPSTATLALLAMAGLAFRRRK